MSTTGSLAASPEEALMNKGGAAAAAGITMGTCLAMIISFSCNHSILWAIIHGCLSWVYVIYRLIVGGY